MLQVISALEGFAIEATDGRIGTVVDFLFDDASWKVRWLVVDCGSWLKGRKVLIHPSAVSYASLEDEQFEVRLTKAQVEDGPALLEHQPVSLQMESRSYDYYGWDPQWRAPYLGGVTGAMASPIMTLPYLGLQLRDEPRTHVASSEECDPHLRSIVEVNGYHIHAIDGEIGHVQDFMLDNEDWRLHYFIVDTSNWWFGKRVLIASQAVARVDWPDRQVQLDVSREKVKLSPPWDPLVAFNEIYRTHLHKHYGWPGSSP
jgi:sporulation protein YlmC with PRC-barrel domain